MTDRPESYPLDGLVLGISASETVEMSGNGLTSRELNRAIRQVAQAVLAQGGRLAFGHDWRSQGVMAEILEFAINHKPITPRSHEGQPLITNYLAWPNSSEISAEDRKRYASVLRIVDPDQGAEAGQLDRYLAEFSYPASRAAALTLMRYKLTEDCDALFCFGGKSEGSEGRYAGVAEEAALALFSRCPLYVTAMFGGGSAQVVQALKGRDTVEMSAFQPRSDVGKAIKDKDPLRESAVQPSVLNSLGVEGLSELNRLTYEENESMFGARQLSEVIGLLLVGLARVNKNKAERTRLSRSSANNKY